MMKVSKQSNKLINSTTKLINDYVSIFYASKYFTFKCLEYKSLFFLFQKILLSDF